MRGNRGEERNAVYEPRARKPVINWAIMTASMAVVPVEPLRNPPSQGRKQPIFERGQRTPFSGKKGGVRVKSRSGTRVRILGGKTIDFLRSRQPNGEKKRSVIRLEGSREKMEKGNDANKPPLSQWGGGGENNEVRIGNRVGRGHL